MREHQEFIAGLCRDIPQLRISAQRFPRPSSDPEWPTERERLQQLAEQQGLEQHRIEVGLKYFDNFDPKQEAKTLEQAVLRSRDRLQQNAERRLASLMGSMLALAVAAFNRAVSNGNDDNEVGTIADIEQATGRIEQREREIWHRLREADIFRVQQEALALGGIATQQIFDETIPKLAAISQLRPKELEDRELGALARSLADLMRRQLRAQALGEKLGWVVGWGEAGSEWEQWVKAAQESSTSQSSYRWPGTLQIRSLATSPERFDNRAVVVEGVVKGIAIRHKGPEREVISTATVSFGDATITASLPFIKIDSGGLVPGAWCRLAGIWRASSEDALGEPALEVDRLSYKELVKSSWFDWVSDRIAPIFTPIPHALAASWSWEPGTDGAGNPLRYGVWCRT